MSAECPWSEPTFILSSLDKLKSLGLHRASALMTLDTYSHLWPDSDDSTRVAVDQVLGNPPVSQACQTAEQKNKLPGQVGGDGEPACRRDSVPPRVRVRWPSI